MTLIDQITRAVQLGYKVTFEKSQGWQMAVSLEESEDRPLGLEVEGQITQIYPIDMSHTKDEKVAGCVNFIINKHLTQ